MTEASQWLQNGDHPEVGPYRPLDAMESLDVMSSHGNLYCQHCGNRMRRHGVLDGANGEEYVCPGDYVVADRHEIYYRMSRGEFESQYEPYVRPPRFREVPLSDLEERKQSRTAERSR